MVSALRIIRASAAASRTLVAPRQRGEDLAAGAEVAMAAMRSFERALERESELAERCRRHSAATARPICSQVGATSDTVARRMSRW